MSGGNPEPIEVSIQADVQSLIGGMKDAQDSIGAATEGMKGDLGALVEAFEQLGPAALLGAAGIGLAFEGIREAASTIMEAVQSTTELAESFEKLHERTGASYEDLAVYKNAMMLVGGSVGDFSSVVTQLQRRMVANPEIFQANNVAGKDWMDTLQKSTALISGIEDPTRRAEIAIALFGGRGQQMIPTLMRMNEVIEKEGTQALLAYGGTIDGQTMEAVHGLQHEIGATTIKIQELDKQLADSGRGMSTWGAKASAAWRSVLLAAEKGINWSFNGVLADEEGDKLRKIQAELAAQQKGGPAETAPSSVTPKELADQKKAADERIQIRRATDQSIIQSANVLLQQELKNDQELVAAGAMTFNEMIESAKAYQQQKHDTDQAALQDEVKTTQGKPVEHAAALNKLAALEVAFSNSIMDLNRKKAENDRKLDEDRIKEEQNTAKKILEASKIAAKDIADAEKTQREQAAIILDQQFAHDVISLDQYVAAKKAALKSELQATLDAKNEEQRIANENGDFVAFARIEAEKQALTRKTSAEMAAIERQAADQTRAQWQGAFQALTNGFQSSISGLIKGTMSWHDALKNVLSSALDGLVNFFVQWGLKAAENYTLNLIMGETSRKTEATGAASVYAVNAMSSVAAIPVVGWAMAPAVGAQALAAGLAMVPSAAGGWDRVPADTLAMIHKDEKVLPADKARGLDNLIASGGQGASGDTHVHFHGVVDAKTFFQQNQGHIMRTIGSAVRNGRTS